MLFLTLALLLLVARATHANDLFPAAEADADKAKLTQAATYLRGQVTHGMSILPDEARDALGWFSGKVHVVSTPGSQDAATENADPTMPPASPSSEGAPFTLGSNLHHKGFLPTHDAMAMGFAMKQNIIDNKLQFTARPFYAQGWRSLQGYWGQEMSLDIAKRADDLPWGKISISYVGGNESLTDHGRGIEWSGDIDLTHNLTFTSGVRQNSITGDSNYVMLRWGFTFSGNP